MSDAEKSFKEWYRIIFLIAISVSIIFLAIFAMLGLRVNSDMVCGRDHIGPSVNAELLNHSNTLDNSTDFIIQEFKLNSTQYLNYEFCFSTYCSAAGAEINIINQDGTILSTEYAINGSGRYCSDITNITDKQYLGISCPSCVNASTSCRVGEVIAGDLKLQASKDSGSLTVQENEIMGYTLYSSKNCKGLIKFFLWCYIWLMVALFLVVLILLGFRRFEKFIFEEMDIIK